MESFTEQEKLFVMRLAFLVLDDAKLNARLVSEMQNEFDDVDPELTEIVFEKLADLVE